MSARSKARKAALDILFAADLKGAPAKTDELALLGRELRDYTSELVSGVGQHRSTIDSLMHTYAKDWDMDRIPALDRNIMRIAIFEMLWGGLDHAIAISEAVLLAQSLSTEGSGKFINGLLARISALSDSLPR